MPPPRSRRGCGSPDAVVPLGAESAGWAPPGSGAPLAHPPAVVLNLCASPEPLRTDLMTAAGKCPTTALSYGSRGSMFTGPPPPPPFPRTPKVRAPALHSPPNLQLVPHHHPRQRLHWVSYSPVAARGRQRPGWTPQVSSRLRASFPNRSRGLMQG